MFDELDFRTILYAEDEAPVRQLISKMLTENGFQVIEAKDGQEAIEIYEKKKGSIHGIISDLKMPNVSGVDFAKYNYEHKFLPFVVCTVLDDSSLALELGKYGVQDYVVKPVEERNFISIVNNALFRRQLTQLQEDDKNPFAGNIGSITIPSKMSELKRASAWTRKKAGEILEENDLNIFSTYVDDFLMNAHEHGNLKISQEEKSELLESGMYEIEIEMRESNNTSKIEISISVLKGEISVNITDDGYGFDYEQYLELTDNDWIEGMSKPNGRGIFMAKQYFDEIRFAKGGASVTLKKRFSK